MIRGLAILLLLTGCAADRQTDDYGLKDISELTLQESNHPHGFAKSECFTCHLPQNIHQVDRIHAPNFYLAQPMVQQSGISSCVGCHGSNGVLQ